jgi:hypothetical protein
MRFVNGLEAHEMWGTAVGGYSDAGEGDRRRAWWWCCPPAEPFEQIT